MSQENVDNLRKAWEIWMAADLAADLSPLDPDVVYEDTVLPDHGDERYHGHDGIRRAWARWAEPWESFETELEWARDAGDEVVSSHRARVRGKASGIETEIRYAYVWRFREGKIIHLKSYASPEQALEAAGLSK
jgi:ketosteroid isomerase-like protein